MYFLYGFLILAAIYIVARIWRSGKKSKLREHNMCCDDCKAKELCDEYKRKNNI